MSKDPINIHIPYLHSVPSDRPSCRGVPATTTTRHPPLPSRRIARPGASSKTPGSSGMPGPAGTYYTLTHPILSHPSLVLTTLLPSYLQEHFSRSSFFSTKFATSESRRRPGPRPKVRARCQWQERWWQCSPHAIATALITCFGLDTRAPADAETRTRTRRSTSRVIVIVA